MNWERTALAAFAAALLANGAAAAPAIRACDVSLNVADQDPAGLNVRATPGGAIIGALKGRNEWVQAHVTGSSGAWAQIDGAMLYTEDHAEGRSVFKGHGFVAFSKLAINELDEQALILAAPSPDAKVLLKISVDDEAKLPAAEVLDCDGLFLKVKVSGIVGWTQNYCSNEFTTCV